MTDLPREDEKFIIQKTVDGFEPEEVEYLLREEQNSPIRAQTIEGFLEQDSVQERLEVVRSVQEKKAEISREDLIRELSEQKDYIVEQRKRLQGSNDDISDQQTKNLLKAIRQLAEMIDVLQQKDSEGGGNVVNINRLEQSFDVTNSVQYLPAEDKRSVVEQLQDDPDVEDFVIKQKQ